MSLLPILFLKFTPRPVNSVHGIVKSRDTIGSILLKVKKQSRANSRLAELLQINKYPWVPWVDKGPQNNGNIVQSGCLS